MDSLKGILDPSRFSTPPEVAFIKAYIKDRYQSDADVLVRQKDIVITVASASLAGSLRLELHQLQKLAQTNKKLLLRIGR